MINAEILESIKVTPGCSKRPIMAIDPSLGGFCIAIEGPTVPLVFKEIKTTAKDWGNDVVGRIGRYKRIVRVAVDYARACLPVLVLIEGYSYHSRGRGILSLAELGGILRYELLGVGDKTVEVPPAVLKKFAARKGNASKTLVVQQLAKRYDMMFSSDNEADAYALLRLGFVVTGYSEAKTRFEKEAVETVTKLIS